jgi:prevent-host-death family protein
MVIRDTEMTMSRSSSWNVAEAKARFSTLMERATASPQTVRRRGKPMAVVVSVEQFAASDHGARWRRFLALSAEVRREGGGEVRVPQRTPRRSPFAR